jgi:hypothetical protein
MSIPKRRRIIIRLEDLSNIMKDYLSPEDLPPTATPVEFMLNPQEHNKLGLRFESDEWQGNLGFQLVDAQLKRYFGVRN